MKEYFIYKYEWPSGHIYIGQSHIGANRYGVITNYKDSPRVYNKMKKYPDFNKEILVSGLSETEVDDFEIYYIKVYNSYKNNNPQYGLNLTKGGYGSHGYSPSLQTRQKMSNAQKAARQRRSKKVYQYTPEGKYLAEYDCCKMAGELTGIERRNIASAANPNNNRNIAGGFKWRYYKVDILDKEA